MRTIKDDVKHVLSESLDNIEVSSNFEELWGEYSMRSKKVNKKRYRAAILAAVIMAMSATAMGAGTLIKRTDNIQYTFENDSKILGSWTAVDFVKRIEDFKVGQPKKNVNNLYLAQLTFKSEGKVSSIIREGGELFMPCCAFTWTKGTIINPVDKTASRYEIKEIDGEEYMFMQWKSGDYTYGRLQEPYYYVLKKADEIVIEQASPKHDDTNIPFQNNNEMIGQWQSVGFVSEIDQFDASYAQGDLYLEKMDILAGGKLNISIDGEVYSLWNWSGNKVINPIDHVVNECTFKEINSKTYMFMQWKTGDYIKAGMKPEYYVLEKQN